MFCSVVAGKKHFMFFSRQKSPRCSLDGMRWWLEKHFSSCAVVSVIFVVVAEIVLGDTYLPYQLCRCVFFFVATGDSFWLHMLVFGCGGKKY